MNPEKHLPKQPPKKTGRRGIKPLEVTVSADDPRPIKEQLEKQAGAIKEFLKGVKSKKALTGKPVPLDPEIDFEKPVTRQKPMSAGPLAAVNPQTPSVANGRFKCFFDRPIFSKYKDVVLIALQFTVPLDQDHDALLPDVIAAAHKDVMKKGRVRINLNGIPAQHAMLFLSSASVEDMATLPACKMVNVNIAMVERKGEGSARKVARLSFRLQSERSEQLAHFAELNMSNDFWLELRDTQETLWDSEEE